MAYHNFPPANPLIEEWDHPFNTLAPRRTTDFQKHATYDYGIKADACACGDSGLTQGSGCACNGPKKASYTPGRMKYSSHQKPQYSKTMYYENNNNNNKKDYYMKLAMAGIGIYLVYRYVL